MSGSAPARIRFTGSSSFLPDSVRGITGTTSIESGTWRGDSSEASARLMRPASSSSSTTPSRRATNSTSSPMPEALTRPTAGSSSTWTTSESATSSNPSTTV